MLGEFSSTGLREWVANFCAPISTKICGRLTEVVLQFYFTTANFLAILKLPVCSL